MAETYTPDNLIAGTTQLITESVTVASSAALTRGAVLGVVTASGKLLLSVSTAIDGSQTPYAVLAEDCDASGGDVTNVAVYVKGEFNENALSFGVGHDATTVKSTLRDGGIYIKSALTA